ncbi:protein kinase [Metabacillus sp. cB07]|uniref:protein kinase domain-containing protein n=1 Tax=Metabacillus sp. cB07 TaxID=2806989 RepID=UPI00193AD358|nr:protein kinase [Metabacillus sp. cB07]
MQNLESFFEIKLNKIKEEFNIEKASLYEGFYGQEFTNLNQIKIFSILHSSLNDLFTFMNQKNNFGFGGHYNAHESRLLLNTIDYIDAIRAQTLNANDYKFSLDDYYSHIFSQCKKFLTSSGGSPIPNDFGKIIIVEERPIFIKSELIRIDRPVRHSLAPIQQIGGGSYATVFEFTDPFLNAKFALKRAKADLREDELERFKLEFQDLKTFDSPFIIKAYRYIEGQNEYIMELANDTLEKYYKYHNHSLSFHIRKMLVTQLLLAFEYIHSKEILHRDISYQNILLKIHEDRIMLKVSDFGLVKRPESTLTRIGTEVKGAINDISDLDQIGFENYTMEHETFALSKVIYFILTGRTGNYHREKNEELRKFIQRGIGPKEKRYKNVEEMRSILSRYVFLSLAKQSVE